MTNTNMIKVVRETLTGLKKVYQNRFATDEHKREATRNATLLLVEKMGYKHWLASNLVELFFTSYVELCRTKISMIKELHGDDMLDLFDKALDELSYDFVWYRDYQGGRKFTTNKYRIM